MTVLLFCLFCFNLLYCTLNFFLKNTFFLIIDAFFAFSENINSPLYMPVTRDLSENKLKTLVQWMKITDPADLKPSEESPVVAAAEKATAEEPADLAAEKADEEPPHPIVLLTRQKNSGISDTSSEKQ